MKAKLRRAGSSFATFRGVPKARRIAEVVVTPSVRFELDLLKGQLDQLSAAHHQTSSAVSGLVQLELKMPSVLNAVSSMSGAARIATRQGQSIKEKQEVFASEIERLSSLLAELSLKSEVELERQLAETAAQSETQQARLREQSQATGSLQTELGKHVGTIQWLLERVETVRAEMLFELRYGKATTEVQGGRGRFVSPGNVDLADLLLNLGAGHVLEAGYLNVDVRELPGIDIVAPVDDLPVQPGSVAEIRSSHLLEHFPKEELRRKLLPYWFGLLKPGAIFRAVVPDLEEMSLSFARGEISFEELRAVSYGGQEYEGDFHFNAFTPESLGDLLKEAGFVEISLESRARKNGDCLEFEMAAKRPSIE